MRRTSVFVILLSIAALAQQPRVFLVNNDNFEVSAAGYVMKGGVRPVSGEQMKDLATECPQVTITSVREKADFVVDWKTKTWDQTSWSGHQNEFAIYSAAGDVVGTGQTHRASAAAKDICKTIQNNWKPKEAR